MWIDARYYYNLGGRIFRSQNTAYLTEGLGASADTPGVMPPTCIYSITWIHGGHIIWTKKQADAQTILEQQEVERDLIQEDEEECMVITQKDMDEMVEKDEREAHEVELIPKGAKEAKVTQRYTAAVDASRKAQERRRKGIGKS